ncbi:MAG: nitrous oxide reductase accessory protein NosL [Herbaspirillum sp.]
MWLTATVLCLFLSACNQATPKVTPIEPTNETASVIDGMLLDQYPGPKAQIHYAESPPEFFSDLPELFTTLLVPEQKRPVVAVFVQDMGKTSWEHPVGNWIDAKTAIYVAGSRKMGSMGATLGSFSNTADAENFIQKEGGEILRYDQVTPEKLKQYSSAAHSH